MRRKRRDTSGETAAGLLILVLYLLTHMRPN